MAAPMASLGPAVDVPGPSWYPGAASPLGWPSPAGPAPAASSGLAAGLCSLTFERRAASSLGSPWLPGHAALRHPGSAIWPQWCLAGGAGAAALLSRRDSGWLQSLLAGGVGASAVQIGAGGCKGRQEGERSDLQPQGGTGSHPSWAKGTGARPRLAPAQQHAAVCLLPVPSPAQALHSQLVVLWPRLEQQRWVPCAAQEQQRSSSQGLGNQRVVAVRTK